MLKRFPFRSMFRHPKRRAGAKPGELHLLGRYQKRLLYGGGVAMTVTILLAVTIGAVAAIRTYIADSRSTFLAHKALLLVEVETKQAAMRRGVYNAELLWADRRRPRDELVKEFAEKGGRLVVQPSKHVDPQLLMGELAHGQRASDYADYLALFEEQAYSTSASAKQRGQAMSGYAFNVDDTFISIVPPPPGGDPVATLGAKDTTGLIREVAPTIGDLHDPRYDRMLLESRKVFWLPPSRDPLTGVESFRLVQPGFEHGKPFVVFVSDLPTDVLRKQLGQVPYDGEFLLLDPAGNVLLEADIARETGEHLAERVQRLSGWKQAFQRFDARYEKGVFTIGERLSDTGWALVYAYTWRTVVNALLPDLAIRAAAAFVIIALMWAFLLYFNRTVFTPLYRRAKQVFDSEHLNRSIIAMAPFGLGLLSVRTGSMMLENGVMARYRSAADAADGTSPLHLRFLEIFTRWRHAHPHRTPAEPLDAELSVEIDGRISELAVSLVKTRYQGEPVLLCGFSDITARKHTERKLDEARRAADDANRAKSTFVATISHEIRTPLNAILGNLELLGRSRLSTLQRDRLATITSSSHALLGVINDVLDFSKAESGQMSVETIAFDVVDVVEQVCVMFAPIAADKGIELACRFDPELASRYLGDPVRVRQIVANLVSNALKFTDEGHVVVDVCERGGRLEIAVGDTGIGIEPERHAFIFDAFTQADATIARRFGGTGLGLALCKRMADLMGGTLTVDSEPGRGSTFVLSLSARHAREASGERRGAFAGRPHVALVSAAAGWRDSIMRHLSCWGIDAVRVSHPAEVPDGCDIAIVFGHPRPWPVSDEAALRRRMPWTIDASADGPRTPVVLGSRVSVSCYAIGGLYAALARALGDPGEIDAAGAADVPQEAPIRVKLLVVEDHPVNRALLKDQFDTLGYDADLADNGVEALRRMSETAYDLVMTDLSMPVMDGYRFAKIVRWMGYTLPIIAITAHASIDELRRCESAGLSEVLTKPMSLAQIDAVVRRQVRYSQRIEPADVEAGETPSALWQLNGELRDVLAETTFDAIVRTRAAIATGDLDEVSRQAHAIKGAFAMVQKREIVEICSAIEARCREARVDVLDALLARLSDRVGELLGPLANSSERG
ncbi:response regulator [Burkholderia multivorans]|uniref:hybrid sensor histidine kinase/response regulator n=1 Tax=Burkholderia multivorans TaxID=87883 RepID=UPI001C250B36|nr:hybrid sensor histidine kinase/response regulator [Burkholderia multivorans]MBU9676287.1 response regulator [Burkholderia multivorans]